MPASIHDDEERNAEEQKDDGKLGFCGIQWQQKFTKKNFKQVDDPPNKQLSISMTKIDDDDDRVEIIPLTSPMKVRSPLGYRSTYNIDTENPNNLNVSSQTESAHLSPARIKTISHPLPPPETSHENLRKPSILSLKSLSMSLRLLKGRGRSDSLDGMELPTTLETIEETTQRSSIFKLDLFEKNLKKFVTKSNEAEFQTYSEYQQQQQNNKKQPKTYFKNQKVYDRRSSMSDINDPNKNPHPKLLNQNRAGISTSSSNVKQETKKTKEENKKQADRTAEMLKEVRKRNMETSKRIQAPRRISTA